jgi:hypothetical protein
MPAQISTLYEAGCEVSRCPLWVKSRHDLQVRMMPALPPKQRLTPRKPVSVLCQKRTSCRLFDHFIRAKQGRRRNDEAEQFRCFQIQDELEPGGCLYRCFRRIGSQ